MCWDKFTNYWDVEMRLVPMEGDRYHLSPEEAVKLCDENTIGVVVVVGSTFDGSYEDVKRMSELLDDLQERTGLDIPIHVDGASGGFIAPFLDPDLEWDFRVPRVRSVFAFKMKDEVTDFTVFDVSARCGSAAGRCRPTRSPRTARTSRRCASWCAAASPSTSPTCCWGDLRKQVARLEMLAAPLVQEDQACGFHH